MRLLVFLCLILVGLASPVLACNLIEFSEDGSNVGRTQRPYWVAEEGYISGPARRFYLHKSSASGESMTSGNWRVFGETAPISGVYC